MRDKFVAFLLMFFIVSALSDLMAQPQDTPRRSFLRGDVLEIDLREAGTLDRYLAPDEQKRVRCIRLSGVMNGYDAKFIRKICDRSGACDESGRSVDNYLDLELERVRIVGGGTYSNRSRSDVITSGMFRNCSCLRYVSLPRDLRSIENEAFYYCSKLEEVRFSGRLNVRSIDDEAFKGCSKLSRINLPEGVESLGDQCFYGCDKLRHIDLPSSLLKIGDEAFCNAGLTSIRLPNRLTNIGRNAFKNTEITSLYLPQGVQVEKDEFGAMPKLREFQVERGNRFYTVEDGVLYDINGTTLLYYPNAKQGTFAVPSGVEVLQHDAFARCSALTSVTFPSSLRTIGANAFIHCTSLRNVEIPASVTTLGTNAFEGCLHMATATIDASIKTLSAQAFYNCEALLSVALPSGLETIGDAAFNNCKALQNVEFGNSLVAIHKEAFRKCGFVQLELPDGITSIGENAFRDCKSMTSVILPRGLKVVPKELFRGCEKLVLVTLPPQLASIGENAFRDCKQLPSLELPATLTTIDNNAFRGTALSQLTLPASIQSIGDKIVEKCKMQSITCLAPVPPTLKKISEKKTPLYVPATSIGAYKQAKQWKDFKNILPIE